jgi:hypothetical protein
MEIAQSETVAPECVIRLPGIKELLGDKAYDSNSFRKSLKQNASNPPSICSAMVRAAANWAS